MPGYSETMGHQAGFNPNARHRVPSSYQRGHPPKVVEPLTPAEKAHSPWFFMEPGNYIAQSAYSNPSRSTIPHSDCYIGRLIPPFVDFGESGRPWS